MDQLAHKRETAPVKLLLCPALLPEGVADVDAFFLPQEVETK